MLLQKRIFEFVESKRTWLTRLASDDAQRERATELRAQLLASGTAWVNEAEALAPALICAWDARRAAYCGAGPFGGPEELAQHRAACKFRPCPCPHGCMEVVSAGRLADHDAACGHKVLPCAQGCAAQVRRRDMAAHCGTSCDCRPVECPFAYLGCAEPVRPHSKSNATLDRLSCHVCATCSSLTAFSSPFARAVHAGDARRAPGGVGAAAFVAARHRHRRARAHRGCAAARHRGHCGAAARRGRLQQAARCAARICRMGTSEFA